MSYTVEPGLYAVGNPGTQSPVFVTANYKMSFDRLREALPKRDGWLLVLDTKGINVWCAAGKGTFGTEELVRRILSSGLTQVVTHRELILPQLGAPGVAAHLVKKASGFKVIYGPIRAKDLPAFLDSGLKATPQMRLKTFTLWERMVLVPIELVAALKTWILVLPFFFFLGGLGGPGGYWNQGWQHALNAGLAFLGAIFAGTVLTPLLLPFLPGRAFSWKGLTLGVVIAGFFLQSRGGHLAYLEVPAWFFLIPAAAAYLAMDFTGATTFTSLSGVKKEMRWAVPTQIAAAGIGLVLWVGSLF